MTNEYDSAYDFEREYEEDSEGLKGNMPLRHAVKIVAEIFNQYTSAREDLEAQTTELTSFIQKLLAQEVVPGDADDWHNLAVDVARKDYFDLACDIIEAGLAEFPSNTDLLGDYLQYGPSCRRIEQCHMYYERLKALPKVKYTWRSFHFSANWLTYLWEQCVDEEKLVLLTRELQELAAQYRRFFPNSEESYLCEANIYRMIKDPKKELKILQQPISRALPMPKCALRLADTYFEAGEYSKSLEMVQRSLNDANQVQQAVNESYLYYLSGLARLSLLRKNDQFSNAEHIEDIYKDFEYSLRLDVRPSLRDSICTKASLLYHQSSVQLPAQCSKLYELLDDKDMLE